MQKAFRKSNMKYFTRQTWRNKKQQPIRILRNKKESVLVIQNSPKKLNARGQYQDKKMQLNY